MTDDAPRKADPYKVLVTTQSDGLQIDIVQPTPPSGNTAFPGTHMLCVLGDPQGSAVYGYLMTGCVSEPHQVEVTPLRETA